MHTDDETRRNSFLERVAAFMLALMAWLFGRLSACVHSAADAMFPELAKRRYEAREAAEQDAAAEAFGQSPELVLAEDPAPSRDAPTLGDLVQRHARIRLGGWARPLEGTEPAKLGGQDVQAWLYGLTDDECRALVAATPAAVTMHVVGMKQVEGVCTVADGARAAAARREAHIRRLEDPDHDWTPAPAYA